MSIEPIVNIMNPNMINLSIAFESILPTLVDSTRRRGRLHVHDVKFREDDASQEGLIK